MPPWRVFLWVKSIEMIMQLRPKAILRTLLNGDKHFLHGMRWYVRMGRRVWLSELFEFLFKVKLLKNGPTVGEFWGKLLHHTEYVLTKKKKPINVDLEKICPIE